MVHARHRHMVRQSPRRRHDAGASGKLGRVPNAASCSSDFDVFDVGATPSQAEVMASPAELMVSHNLGGGVPRRATWSHPARGRASPAPSLRPALAPRSPRAWWAAALAWALSCAVLLLTQSGVPLLCSLACVSATALAARAGAGPRRKPRPVKFATQIRPRNLRPLVPRAAPPSLRPAASGEASAGDAAAARQQLLPAVAALERYEAAAAPPTAAVEGLDAAAVAAALDGVDARVRDEQWLDAAIELRALDAACEQLPRNHPAAAAMAAAAAADAGRAQPLESVRARGREIGSALRELGSADGWEFATETHGASTYHKRDASDRLWLKTDGVMRGVGCLECVSFWREADLFDRWFPMCSRSRVLKQMGRCEMLAWMELSPTGPIGRRDAVLHGYGVDALDDGFMMILGRSVEQSEWADLRFPVAGGFGAARMLVHGLQVLIQPLGPDAVRCVFLSCLDLQMPVPPPVLQLATQTVVGMIHHQLEKEARRIHSAAAASDHAARMERDAHIYWGWMKPRVDATLRELAGGGDARPPPR